MPVSVSYSQARTEVERLVERKLAGAAVPAERDLYRRQVESTDRQIDALVYELYGLTEEEIRVVEGEKR